MPSGLDQVVTQNFRVLNHFYPLLKEDGFQNILELLRNNVNWSLVQGMGRRSWKGCFWYSLRTAHDTLSPEQRFSQKISSSSSMVFGVFPNQLMGLIMIPG